jgi:hypothetical protein
MTKLSKKNVEDIFKDGCLKIFLWFFNNTLIFLTLILLFLQSCVSDKGKQRTCISDCKCTYFIYAGDKSCLSYNDYVTCTLHYNTLLGTHTHTHTHHHYTFSQFLFNQTNGAFGYSFQNSIYTMHDECSLL